MVGELCQAWLVSVGHAHVEACLVSASLWNYGVCVGGSMPVWNLQSSSCLSPVIGHFVQTFLHGHLPCIRRVKDSLNGRVTKQWGNSSDGQMQ